MLYRLAHICRTFVEIGAPRAVALRRRARDSTIFGINAPPTVVKPRPAHLEYLAAQLIVSAVSREGVVKRTLDSEADYGSAYAPLFSYSARMRAIRTRIEGVADTDVTILIRGESGVGKELAARAIHLASARRAGPFVRVNCAALPAELLESELFGHEKGAFTGAYRTKPSKFELAAKGTLLLDEIGDMPLSLQAKLLHVLQDGEFVRVGGTEPLYADVRVIAATNQPLEGAIAAGRFREDLFYRLNVVTIRIPALRERPEEIPILVGMFLQRFNEQYGRHVRLSEERLKILTRY